MIVATLICIIFLLSIHMYMPHLKTVNFLNLSILHSIAGGIGLATVLVHLLPDTLADVPKIAGYFANHFLSYQKNVIFLIMLLVLVGFIMAYSVEKVAHANTANKREHSNFVYHSHLFMSFVPLFAATGTFASLFRHSIYSLLLVTFLVAAVIVMEEHSATKHFKTRDLRLGRLIISAAMLSGWACGVFIFHEDNLLFTTFIYSIAIGIILMSVVKTEFDLLEQKSHFLTFLLSVAFKVLATIALLIFEYNHVLTHVKN